MVQVTSVVSSRDGEVDLVILFDSRGCVVTN